jgi:hypothetical protein
MPLDMYIITVFCWIEYSIKEIENQQGSLRQRGESPTLFDSEVICMEIVGEFLGLESDKDIWTYFLTYWLNFFPRLTSRTSFTRQCANLYALKQQIHEKMILELKAYAAKIHVIDGFPLPIFRFGRAHVCKIFKGDASYGYCAAKKETYYGFKGEIVIDEKGIICAYTFAKANTDEREILWDITDNISNLLIGDKGFISEELKTQLVEERNITLETPLRKNMKENRPLKFVQSLFKKRKLVETVISQLCDRFHIQNIKAKDVWHFSNKFVRKILSHTFAAFINIREGRSTLRFESLVAS